MQQILPKLDLTTHQLCHRVHPVLVPHQSLHIGREAEITGVQLEVRSCDFCAVFWQRALTCDQQRKIPRRHLRAGRDAACGRPHEADPSHTRAHVRMEDVLVEPAHVALRHSQCHAGVANVALQERKFVPVPGAEDDAVAPSSGAVVEHNTPLLHTLDAGDVGGNLALNDVRHEHHVLASEFLTSFLLPRQVAKIIDQLRDHRRVRSSQVDESRGHILVECVLLLRLTVPSEPRHQEIHQGSQSAHQAIQEVSELPVVPHGNDQQIVA
mmetsp:Transcript_65528/g.213353  ORF Transcript_65528/g.213353 Transcript_65528/m.213353 type:complete len:268 (-) Transcript_65528:819-1622(-)